MEMSVLALIIWGEITFLLAGGLALLLTHQWILKRNEKKSAQHLILKIDKDRQQRQEDIRQGLSAYGLEGELLEEKVAQIDKQELKLYQRIVNMYRKRSAGMLSNINVAVESSTRPYYELDISLDASKSGDAAADNTVAGEQASAEVEALQQKNQELELELGVAMETIGRMLSEYSSLFNSENDDQTDLDKNKIMQAFSADQVAEQAQTADSGLAEEDEIVAVAETAESDEETISEDVDFTETEPEPDQAESMDTDELLEIDDVLTEEAPTQEDDELDVVVEDQSDVEKPETAVDEQKSEDDEDLSDVSITDITEEMLGVQDKEVREDESNIDSGFDENVEEDLLGAVSLDDEDIAELEAAGLTDIVDDAAIEDQQDVKDEEVEVTDLDEFDIEKLLAENKEK